MGIGEIPKVDCMDLFEEIIRDNQKAEMKSITN